MLFFSRICENWKLALNQYMQCIAPIHSGFSSSEMQLQVRNDFRQRLEKSPEKTLVKPREGRYCEINKLALQWLNLI